MRIYDSVQDYFVASEEEQYCSKEEQKTIKKFLTELIGRQKYNQKTSERNIRIVEMRFGIGNENGPMTYKEIGEVFGLTNERVQQIIFKILRKCLWYYDRSKSGVSGAFTILVQEEFGKIKRLQKMKEKQPLSLKKKGNVYFIQDIKNNIVKIGYSKNPQDRLKGFQKMIPYSRLILKLVLPDTDISDEKRLHRQFKKDSLGNEWFKYNEELKSFMLTQIKIAQIEVEKSGNLPKK